MGSGESSRIGRKGMSPLIATVLLMAFAVALGGMIMNWSIDATNQSGDCDLIKIRVVQFCSQGDKILLSMRNDPESVQLRGIKLNLLESNYENTLNIRESALAPGQPLDIAIPAVTTLNTIVDILGVVGTENNPLTCTAPIERANPLKSC